MLRNIDSGKSIGIDTFPLKLVQLPADNLYTPLTNQINNTASKGKFPNDAKIASAFPLVKHEGNRYSISLSFAVLICQITSQKSERKF